MRIEGLDASCSPSFDPLTDRPFTHPQRYRDILLLPTRLFQLPRSFASFFSPIGFLWCSHTSYLTTLYFPLPRSVVDYFSDGTLFIRSSGETNGITLSKQEVRRLARFLYYRIVLYVCTFGKGSGRKGHHVVS